MNDVISWVIEVSVKPGQLENSEALVEKPVHSTRGEPKTLAYEWFLSDDKSSCHIYERYADSAATMSHLKKFDEKIVERLLNAVDLPEA